MNKKTILLALLSCLTTAGNLHAQLNQSHYQGSLSLDKNDMGLQPIFARMYFNADWQLNAPLRNDITDGAGSLGGHFEAGYYATENVGIGAFVAFQNNEEDHLTSTDAGYAPDTEQRNRLYQLPFGLSGRYRWAAPDALFTPYVALKLGAEYAESNLYVANMQTQLHSWGFFLSPEVGTEIYPFHRCKFGFHVALYYSFATNDASLAGLSARRLHNCGARFGVAF